MRILTVDSDEDSATGLSRELRRHGHDVAVLTAGSEAVHESHWADVVVTELDLPDVDGINLCREVRDASDVPIIVRSARDTEVDRVLALRAGADDFVTKPCGLPELLARIEAVARRRSAAGVRVGVVTHGVLRIDLAAYVVTMGDELIEVTRKEFELLKLLASEPDEVLTRARIMQEVWRDHWTGSNSRTIDTHVNSLRRKLGSRDSIATVRGIGFRIGPLAGPRPSMP